MGDPSQTMRRQTIDYQDNTYQLKNRLTTILLLGIDQRQEEARSGIQYRHGGQCDFLLLVVVDDNAKTVSTLQINRDSMTELKVLNLLGQSIGTQTAQICLAYAYGDGGAVSCGLAVDAVRNHLMNTPIDHYFAMDLDGISVMNDFLGGIEVTLEDDFSVFDSEMTPGKTIRLQGKQAEIFLRSRHYVGDGSNALRMKRQKLYLGLAKDALASRIENSPSYLLDLFDALTPYATTDMNRGFIINLSNRCNRYELLPETEITGTSKVGEDGYLEFYADETSLMDAILTTFYEPI